MMNNPIMMLFQVMQSGGNPQAIMQQLMQQDPAMRGAMPLIQGKGPDELKSTFTNMCRERGVQPEQFARRFGVNLPK